MAEVSENEVNEPFDQIPEEEFASLDALCGFETTPNSKDWKPKSDSVEIAQSTIGSDQKVDDLSSLGDNSDFHMTLRSPKAYSRRASISQMTPKSVGKVKENDTLLPSASFHMSLRSPKVYNNASASKLQKMSHKKATPQKTPEKPTEDFAEITIVDSNKDVQADVVPAVPSKRISPYKQGDVIPRSTTVVVTKLFKSFKVRNFTKIARKSSLYEPTKSSTQRLRTSSAISATSSETVSKDRVMKRVNVTRRPTIPVTPKFKSEERSRMHSKVLSTDEREALELEEEMKAEVLRIRNAKKVFQWARRNTTITTLKSTKELTIPTTPVSHLTKKLGHKTCSIETGIVPKEEPKPKDESFQNKPLTQFEPFQFAISRKSARSAMEPEKEKEIVIGAAEAAAKFFRDPRSHGAPKEYTTQVTAPMTPKFARLSSRPKPPSHEEQEDAAFKEMQGTGFKAKPLDKRIFQSMGELGVPKVAAKRGTDFAPFELKSIQRTRTSNPPTEDENEGSFSFKARPMPSYQETPSHGTVNRRPTIPKSPKLSGGLRASVAPARRQRSHHTIVEKAKREAAARAQNPAPVHLTLTETVEFHLQTEDRGFTHRAHREQRERQESVKEAAARNVRANPMPVQTKPAPVAHSSRELTEFKEFKLQSLVRHSSDLAAQAKLINENDEIDAQARTLPRTTFEPDFSLEIENRAPLVSFPVNLETDIRAQKRREFDGIMALKMVELEQLKESAAKQKLDTENRKIKELRKMSVEQGGMSFRAAPILTKDPYPTRCTAPAPLTEPKSPSFGKSASHRARESEITAALRDM